MKQKLISTLGEVFAEREVLAGPTEWNVKGYLFSTVIVRAPDDSIRGNKLSVVDVRTGRRIGRVSIVRPRTSFQRGLMATSALIDELRNRVGDDEFIATLARPLSIAQVEACATRGPQTEA